MSGPTRNDDPTTPGQPPAPKAAAGPDSFNPGGAVPELGGTFIGKYQIKREIGSGGMGVVYEAVQDQPRRSVALKIMRSGVRSAGWVRRFQGEAQALARLRHPYIAQVYEAGTDGFGVHAVPFFVMEYVPGALALDEYCKRKGLSIRQRLELVCKVCEAVEHGHAHGIIHRDLKPANLLVDSGGVPKVIDFGVARADDADQVAPELQTQAATMVGTLQYMSPEQCRGDPASVDARSDVYSLGVVLYELLCGKSPYNLDSLSLIDASRLICEGTPTPPSEHNRELRGEIETVILKALQKSPDRRYPSAAALRSDIERILAGEPIEARRDSATYVFKSHVRRGVARHRVATALIVIVAGVLATFFLAIPFVHTWTPIDRFYQRRMTSLLDRPSDTPLETVRLIALTESTDVAGIAEREQLSNVSAAHPKSMRRFYGRLMEKLVHSGAKVIVFDMSFIEPSEFDQDFVKGVLALKAAGKSVVVGTRTWAEHREGSPAPLSPAIAAHVKAGSMVSSFGPDAPWALDLVVQHPDSTSSPSLALAAFGQYRYPGSDLSPALVDLADTLRLRYHKDDPSTPGFSKVAAAHGEIELTSVRAERGDAAAFGLHTGTLVGRYNIRLPSDRALASSSVDMGQVMAADNQQLKQWFETMALVIGDTRANRDGPFETPNGRWLNGSFAHATGIDALLRGLSIRQARLWHEIVLAIVTCSIGVLIASRPRRSMRWKIVALLAAIVCVLAVALVAYRGMSLLFDPFVYMLGMIFAFVMLVWLQRAARSAVV